MRLAALLADSDPTIRHAQGEVVKGTAENYGALALVIVVIGVIALLADRL